MILCVGLQHVAPVDEFPVDKWDKMIALNLSASFHTTRLFVPGMKERGDNPSNVTSTDMNHLTPILNACMSELGTEVLLLIARKIMRVVSPCSHCQITGIYSHNGA